MAKPAINDRHHLMIQCYKTAHITHMLSFFKKKQLTNHRELPAYWHAYEAQFKDSPPANENGPFVVLDTETTGFDYEKDRILCIGALRLVGHSIQIKDGFEVFVQQDHYSKETAAIHGILKGEGIKSLKVLENKTAAIVSEKTSEISVRLKSSDKMTELEALKSFLVYLGSSVIIAHHAFFDINMINKAMERHGLPSLKNKSLDTVNLYKKSLLRSPLIERKAHYSLDELADKFNISKKDRHTALGDAYITALLFLKIIKKIKEKTGRLEFKRLF